MRVACCQFDIKWEDKPANYARVERLVRDAKLARETLLLLPEMFATGFTMNAGAIAEPTDGPTSRFVADLAKANGIYVLAGVVADGPRNEAWLFSPSGELSYRYAKIHPFTPGGESKHYLAGQTPSAFEVNGWRVSTAICYDLRFPEMFRKSAVRDAPLICVIASWPIMRDEHWMALLKARAIENQAYVAGNNRCGRDPNFAYSGRSQIISPLGEILADAGSDETIISAELDRESMQSYRAKLPFLDDAKL